jgi:hypothetical protein
MSVKQVRKDLEIVKRAILPRVNVKATEIDSLLRDYDEAMRNVTREQVEAADQYVKQLEAEPSDDPYELPIAKACARNLHSVFVDRRNEP